MDSRRKAYRECGAAIAARVAAATPEEKEKLARQWMAVKTWPVLLLSPFAIYFAILAIIEVGTTVQMGALPAAAALSAFGVALFLLKRRSLYWYSVVEVGFAVQCFYWIWANLDTLGASVWVSVAGALYVVVRGLENFAKWHGEVRVAP